MIATPQGRVSRYLMGVAFDPAELRSALDSAAHEHIGTLSDRIALLCAHFDPSVGRHSPAVMKATRVIGAAMVLGFIGWIVARRRAHSAGARR